jgi:flagellar biosynthesis protein
MSERRILPRRAVAIEYDVESGAAPHVSASGQGPIAEEILRLARAAGVPVREDPDLVEVLGRLEVGTLIPPELYLVVAEILAHLYRMNQSAAPAAPEPPGVHPSLRRRASRVGRGGAAARC